ncbi:MAG: HypC/HybG/HupF family hydrogenase formation chaperone [Candidatus Aminicenantes bacterium]|nr:HypC/HybG/HupF family hydrogenase formation chaperone [Candidatus Aminicenantes bacterium]
MCIAVPMKVVEINGNMGFVEYSGVKREVGLMLMDDTQLGDWVLIHAGFAISKLNPEEAEETLSLLKQAELIE